VPEQLIKGREDVFFGYEFAIQGGKLPDDVIKYYASHTTRSNIDLNPIGELRSDPRDAGRSRQSAVVVFIHRSS
jgi:hypothetical protein